MNDIIANYNSLKNQINEICKQNAIDYPIQLMAVSKTHRIEDIIKLHTNTNQIIFGENYVQELYEKAQALIDHKLQWHFIGNIQSNKIKFIAESAAWVHSLASAKHALLLNKNRTNALPKLNVLIEVNISNDATKHGMTTFAEIIELANVIVNQDNLVLRGLMGMTGATADPILKNLQFAQLKQLFDKLKSTLDLKTIDTLSMGMSDDFELAITNGANILRIGSLIFGNRTYKM